MIRGYAHRSMTPSLQREARRMSDLRHMGCTCAGAPHIGRLGAIGAFDATTTAGFSAQVQAQLKAQASSVQATLANETGVDTTDARVGAGAQATASLVQNGYNPENQDDNDKLIAAIAGGACLIPGVGPLLGGAIEGLWQIAKPLSCPVINAFASIGLGGGSPACGAPVCKSKGLTTPAAVLANLQHKPPMPKGSFAELAYGSLAYFAAQNANCKGGVPPNAVVDSLLAIWNKTHAGPAIGVFIPPLDLAPSGSLAAPAPGPGIVGVAGNVTDQKTGNVNPYIYYAFQPVSAIVAHEGMSQIGTGLGQRPKNLNAAQDWSPWFLTTGFFGATVPRIALLNSGPLLPPLAPPPKKQLAFHLAPAPAKKQLAFHLGPSSSTTAKASAPKSASAAAGLSTGEKVAAAGTAAAAATLVWWLHRNRWKWKTPRWMRG